MNRSERRTNSELAKSRALRIGKAWRIAREHLTPEWIGKSAAMHNTCPCWACRGEKYDRPESSRQITGAWQ